MNPVNQNVEGVRQLVASGMNKTPFGSNPDEGAVDAEREDVLTLNMDDEELLALARHWENKTSEYEGKIKARQETIKAFYLGKQEKGSSSIIAEQISSNLLFEAEETYLPAALAKNPEPVVWSDNSAEGAAIAKTVKTMLQYHADTLNLRGALKMMTRQNSIYLLGVVKHGWDPNIQDIKLDLRRPQRFILDPEGFVNRFGDYEGYSGERIDIIADDLAHMFPKSRAYIIAMVDGKMGTKVFYTEWWSPSDEYCFYTFKGKVLDKHKNQYFNYDEETTEEGLDGEPVESVKKARNHFGRAKKPYTFLSVFSLEEQPHDITSLIEQNIPNQRRISRRTEQIDYNLSRANNSDVFSENNFDQESAKQVSRALAVGNPVLVPKGGPIIEAIHRLDAPGIDGSFFTELETSKNDLRQIFGVAGITNTPGNDDKTVRGKIIDQQHDSTRIGGGVGDALETVADNIFNWWVQLYYVFYDEKHVGMIVGSTRAIEYVNLESSDLTRKLVVSVSPNSMKPKDEVTEMNQALSLFEAGALDPKTLLTILDFPDPAKTAENTVLWKLDPQTYIQLNFPELAQQLAQAQAARAVAPGGAPVPEQANGEPAGGLEAPEANPSLSQVPISSLGVPQ